MTFVAFALAVSPKSCFDVLTRDELTMRTYGVSSSLLGDLSFEEALARIAGAGFSQVEMGSDEGAPFSSWRVDTEAANRTLAELGVKARSVHVPSAGWNLADPDAAGRRAKIEIVAACLEPAAAVGVEVVVCHHNTPVQSPAVWDRGSMKRSRESLAVLADRAGELGLKLAVENLPARGTPRPGGPIAEVLEIIDGLGDHIGVCVDAGHSNANGQSAAGEVAHAGAKVFAVHIQDSDGSGADQHLLPGAGTTDWDAFRHTLDEVAPDCVRTFEVGATPETAEEVLAAVARLRELWAR